MAQRVFFDWNQPLLPEVAPFVVDHFGGSGQEIDLSHLVCVVPGSRAGRRLLAELIRSSRAAGRQLIPPTIITPGRIPQTVVETARPIATALEWDLFWNRALRSLSEAAQHTLGLSDAASDDAVAPVADLVADLRASVDAADRTLANVAGVLEQMDRPAEAERWQLLSAVESRYMELLADAGLTDETTECNRALVSGDINEHLVYLLISTPELNRKHRRFLSRVADHLTSIVHAPESMADRFDDYGCVQTEAWLDVSLPIQDGSIHIADRPVDQAHHAIHLLARAAPHRSAADIVIGDPGGLTTAAIKRAAAWAGLDVHAADGDPIGEASPIRLLAALADWLDRPTPGVLGAILRLPDVERWLARRERTDDARTKVSRWLGLIERYYEDQLAPDLSEWLGPAVRHDELRQIKAGVDALAQPLSGDSRPLGRWCEPIMRVLRRVFGHLPVSSRDRYRTVAACRALGRLLAEIAAADTSATGPVTCTEAIRFALRQARDLRVPSPAPAETRARQIELLGWLELHLDTAPMLILTGFNEPDIPRGRRGHPMLPESLASAIGIASNKDQAARDLYLMSAILHSKREVHVIAGRRGDDEEPLEPSRFLFACDDDTVHQRVVQWCDAGRAHHPLLPAGLATPRTTSSFEVPEIPTHAELPARMAVTHFGRYLRCPYRFALERLLSLRVVSVGRSELEPRHFGSLAHAALEVFGHDPHMRDSTHRPSIARFLDDALDELARTRYGARPLPAVRVQIEQLRERLRDFARWQADRRSSGWVIRHTEFAIEDVELDVPGEDSIVLSAKIDRIEEHEQSGEWALLDYKTGRHADSPYRTHNHSRSRPRAGAEVTWHDLQLPLYDFVVRRSTLQIADDIALGYIVLPERAAGVCEKVARWEPAHLDEAVEHARTIVRAVRAREFTMNRDASGPFDDFARLCQAAVLAPTWDEEADDE